MMKAILFDIDGTMLRLDGAGREALSRATAAEGGIGLDDARAILNRIDFRGATDTMIAETIAGECGYDRATRPGFIARILGRYVELLDGVLETFPRKLMPGVMDVLREAEERRSDVVVGLLTGNLRAGARIKLDTFDLGRLADRPGAFGDDGRERSDIARIAADRLQEVGVSASRTVVVGDTEHDVAAARAVGARAVAVSTGWTDEAALAASEPDLLLDDLSDHRSFWQLIEVLD